MTTLAYRDGILAIDTGVSLGGCYCPGGMSKYHTRDDGRRGVACGSGTAAIVQSFLRAVEHGKEEQFSWDADKDAVGYFILPNGDVEEYSVYGVLLTQPKYFADGAGSQFALGALAAGGRSHELRARQG